MTTSSLLAAVAFCAALAPAGCPRRPPSLPCPPPAPCFTRSSFAMSVACLSISPINFARTASAASLFASSAVYDTDGAAECSCTGLLSASPASDCSRPSIFDGSRGALGFLNGAAPFSLSGRSASLVLPPGSSLSSACPPSRVCRTLPSWRDSASKSCRKLPSLAKLPAPYRSNGHFRCARVCA